MQVGKNLKINKCVGSNKLVQEGFFLPKNKRDCTTIWHPRVCMLFHSIQCDTKIAGAIDYIHTTRLSSAMHTLLVTAMYVLQHCARLS